MSRCGIPLYPLLWGPILTALCNPPLIPPVGSSPHCRIPLYLPVGVPTSPYSRIPPLWGLQPTLGPPFTTPPIRILSSPHCGIPPLAPCGVLAPLQDPPLPSCRVLASLWGSHPNPSMGFSPSLSPLWGSRSHPSAGSSPYTLVGSSPHSGIPPYTLLRGSHPHPTVGFPLTPPVGSLPHCRIPYPLVGSHPHPTRDPPLPSFGVLAPCGGPVVTPLQDPTLLLLRGPHSGPPLLGSHSHPTAGSAPTGSHLHPTLGLPLTPCGVFTPLRDPPLPPFGVPSSPHNTFSHFSWGLGTSSPAPQPSHGLTHPCYDSDPIFSPPIDVPKPPEPRPDGDALRRGSLCDHRCAAINNVQGDLGDVGYHQHRPRGHAGRAVPLFRVMGGSLHPITSPLFPRSRVLAALLPAALGGGVRELRGENHADG